ncbi:MAG TPA: Hint domain-containing protein, partial [Pilimelia sp.]|nr:Hint domain-containing protein [Pilimelia sp.]
HRLQNAAGYLDVGEDLIGAACSFSGDTRVLMADGSTKRISEVKKGDLVLAGDPRAKRVGKRRVLATWVHLDQLGRLHLADGRSIVTTEDHPFWNETDQQWQRADALDAGDLLLAADASTVRVGGFSRAAMRMRPAHNLTVQDLHTYYVVAENTPVLVHNTGPDCGTAFGRMADGAKDFHGSEYSLDEITEFVNGHTGDGNPLMGRPSRTEVEAALRNAVPEPMPGTGVRSKFEHNGVRVIVNFDMPWRSTAYYPGR